MVDRIDINDRFSVGKNHPSREEFEAIAEQGFKSVVNMREADEEDQPLDPKDEGAVVQQLDMEYLHYPVSSDAMSPEIVDEFRDQVDDLPGPVFAHCQTGSRSGAFIMMHVASESGMDGDQALSQAKSMGFECDSEELEQFVKDYIDDHGE